MPDPISWIIIALCIFGHFFFSLSETALANCNKFKMQVEADEGKKVSKIIVKITERYDQALTTILVGNNVVAIVISTISTLLFYKYLTAVNLNEYASLFSSLIMTFVVYLVGDTLPKTIAKSIPDTISKFVAYPIYLLMIILFPISLLFEGMVKLFEIIFKNNNDETFTSEDLEKVLEKSEEDGIIDEEQAEIIQSALDFKDTTVKEVLTRRNKIFALDINELNNEKLNQILATTSYSRIPIYDGELENFIGTLHVKTYIKECLANPNVDIRSLLQEPYKVKNKIMIINLLSGFKSHHTHLALVENKDEKVIGMVTMEDVLEELVEDISEPNVLKKGGE